MGKEKEISGAEEFTQGRREGRGTPTSIARRGGDKQQDLGTKNHYFQGCHLDAGPGFFPGYFFPDAFIGKQKKNITKRNP